MVAELAKTFLLTGSEYDRYRPGFPEAAVDPSEPMLAELRRKLPHVHAVAGTAESIPVDDASHDAVTVGQAFHWFDRQAACAEIVRVLRPGGRLGLMWNGPDPGCAWDLACHEIAHPGSTTVAEDAPDPPRVLPGLRLVRTAEVPWDETLTREHYLARWLIVSTFLASAPRERDAMVAAVGAVLDEHPDTRGRDELRLTQRTWVEIYELATG